MGGRHGLEARDGAMHPLLEIQKWAEEKRQRMEAKARGEEVPVRRKRSTGEVIVEEPLIIAPPFCLEVNETTGEKFLSMPAIG
eukprot:506322-Hanusia_phi.AAC.2